MNTDLIPEYLYAVHKKLYPIIVVSTDITFDETETLTCNWDDITMDMSEQVDKLLQKYGVSTELTDAFCRCFLLQLPSGNGGVKFAFRAFVNAFFNKSTKIHAYSLLDINAGVNDKFEIVWISKHLDFPSLQTPDQFFPLDSVQGKLLSKLVAENNFVAFQEYLESKTIHKNVNQVEIHTKISSLEDGFRLVGSMFQKRRARISF